MNRFSLLAASFSLFLCSSGATLLAQPPGGQGRGGMQRGQGGGARQPIVVSHGLLPDTDAFTADGKPMKVRDLIQGKYTVLKTGCLTCPEFLRAYADVEAMAKDYADKDVQFFYVFQSLRHPEREGYVQAQNMSERLLQVAEAKKKLGTNVPWIADTIDDSFRVAMKTNSNSVFVISPDSEIVYAADRMNGDGLQQSLSKLVGPIENPTSARDLQLPQLARFRSTNVTNDILVERPDGLVILKTTPENPADTYYVKLRAEAEPALLETGTGRLFLGFYPDPIHDAHWNNLTPGMKYELQLPAGIQADPATAVAKKGPGESDAQPRQFWVNIDGNTPLSDINLSLHYFACAPGMCEAMTHKYTISFTPEDRNSRTYSFNRGQGAPGGGMRPGSDGERPSMNRRRGPGNNPFRKNQPQGGRRP